jgi:hypothetical protein
VKDFILLAKGQTGTSYNNNVTIAPNNESSCMFM